MIKTLGVAHFTLAVTDTVRSMAFYVDILGMTPVQVNHERGMVFLDCGGDCIILTKSDAKIDPNDHDVHHAFIVAEEEYETAKDQLREKGINIFLGRIVRAAQSMVHALISTIQMATYSKLSTSPATRAKFLEPHIQ